MEVYEAINAVLHESNNEYAKSYANAALYFGDAKDATIVSNDKTRTITVLPHQTDKSMVGEELFTQVLYILSNITYWRGGRSKEVRQSLKDFVANYKKERGY